MQRLSIYAILFLVVIAAQSSAQVSQTAVPFLLIAPGARAGGMGETFVSIADDATATHWNPAGLGNYPLSPLWLELPSRRGYKIEKLVLVKNDMPENNYKQFDIWALMNGHLVKWEKDRWNSGIAVKIGAGTALSDIVARYTGAERDQLSAQVDQVLQWNLRISRQRLESVINNVLTRISDSDPNAEYIRNGVNRLTAAYAELKLLPQGFINFEKSVQTMSADGRLSTEETDTLIAEIDHAVSAKAMSEIRIPFDLPRKAPANCLESHDGMIYAGTDSGFYRFDPTSNKWRYYGLPDSLPALKVTALDKMGKKSIVVGTENGIAYYNGVRIKQYSSQETPPQGYISNISAISDQSIWAATDRDLYHYDGGSWKNYMIHEVSVGETLGDILKKIYRTGADLNIERLKEQVRRLNDFSDEVTLGQKIKLPYAPALWGDITSLAAKDKYLWIGTENGLVLFDGESFVNFGYRVIQADREMSVFEMARNILPEGSDEQVERLAGKILELNELEGETIPQGKSLVVYANQLGSKIFSVSAVSQKKAYVGTAYGVVEYNDGIWSRFARLEGIRSPVHTIENEYGELWFAGSDRIYLLARPRGQVTFMHSNYLTQLAPDLYYDYFAIVYPTSEWGTFGTGITFLSYGQQDRTNEVGDVIGQFTSYDLAWTVSYGTKLMKSLSAGISARIIISHLADVGAGLEKGKGVGFSGAVDGGVLYNFDRRTDLAATITNIGPEIAYIDADQADPLPRKLAVAFAYKLIDSPYNRLTIVGEANKLLVDLNDDLKTEIREIIPHIGAEYWYSNYIAVRAGYVYDDIGVQRYMTLGGSLQYSRLRVDLSYIPSSNEETNRLGNTVRLSINVGF